ncbi:carbohydrate ABC transporter permease [Deinococcus cellulosilyticus]|uniref:Cytochrome c biogenesis protein n=1 Tax=Deinococcus cellulosilyticus (strain DSM 18568 / NBRC 106333 / KACC 11606 / 5516J-15) TaxID=1223518 RepID=A0A511N383_DEIC1|nr:sugar ABC transporter permease [Deinococcus cellulosilyticus]GEM47310.1 cytochrome c biogenesis protein [Deinococcus cellulosilyticus NBRC 106333 = KACC 11606]
MTTTTKQPQTRNWNWSHLQKQAAPYLFVSPFFVLFAVFGLFPIVFSLLLAFSQWDSASGLSTMHWVKPLWSNFQYVLTDPLFATVLKNTFWIAIVSGLPQHLVAIPLAYVLHTQVGRFKHFFTAAFLVPFVTSTVAIALVTTVLFSERNGAVNQLLLWLNNFVLFDPLIPDQTGEGYIQWLFEKEYTKPLVCLLIFWRYFGYNTVLYLTGLQTISNDIYEAAQVDGATRWQQFWHITLPLLRPIAYFTTIGTVVGNLNLFDEVFILFSGPPSGGEEYSAQTIGLYLYNNAFGPNQDMGAAAATSWVLFVIVLLITLITNAVFRRTADPSEA